MVHDRAVTTTPQPAFHLSPGQARLRQRAARSASDVLRPVAEAGIPGRVNRSLVGALAAEGLLPRLFPQRAGGSREGDVSALELCLLREGLALGCTEAETALALQGLGAYPILQSGRPEAVERWIPRVARGEAVAAFALSEPDSGSDAGSLRTAAEVIPGGHRLTGVKTWISNAPEADVYTVFARTGPDPGPRGVSAFVVRGDAPGLSGSPLELLAPHPIGRLELDGVEVGEGDLLGEVGEGFKVAMRTLDLFRPSVGAFAVGMAQAAIDVAVAHASERRQFGRPLSEFQAVSHALADVATEVEAARLLVYRAASAHDAGLRETTGPAAMAKLKATEVAQRAVDVAIQVLGARGLERGHPLEHLYREVRAPRIYEGTSEIQRSIIARELFRSRARLES